MFNGILPSKKNSLEYRAGDWSLLRQELGDRAFYYDHSILLENRELVEYAKGQVELMPPALRPLFVDRIKLLESKMHFGR